GGGERGGGGVAGGRAGRVLAPAAAVASFAHARAPERAGLAAARRVSNSRRVYRTGDLVGFFLAFVATDAPSVTAAVWREGRRRGVLVNAADDPAHCDFILPSVLRRGELTVAVATGGATPALARAGREKLETPIGQAYGSLAAVVAQVRRELRARGHRVDAATWHR